jgi:hypothetical protein
MLNLIFTIGQAGCALLLLYGAYLVLMPARRKSNPAVEEQAAMRSHMLYDI